MVRHKILKFETKGKKTEYINIKDDVIVVKFGKRTISFIKDIVFDKNILKDFFY